MKTIIFNSWQEQLAEEFQKEYYQHLRAFLKEEYAEQTIYPEMENIFEAFQRTPYEKVKVVILGQDPYHGPGQAHGLSFSVMPDVALPPSLRNIYKELENDLGIPVSPQGNLEAWTDQGVLLLNTVLTVRNGQANSHRGKGWEQLTDAAIERLNQREQPVIFVLWGRQARDKKRMIDIQRHYILEAPHPSPLSAHRGFFGSKPFSKINQQLSKWGQEPIDWKTD
ncbi:uracil-DNA glycosylase [Vagococcus elongatus]|uniref:Uracil-DNA glycosylase n=1 Tax=Vagococcus elongatus TaxID=180344 RepID=A0A430AMG8_9ENTE|nr:uracil-DNA glycosylase [Vagococcus elongatus]RSU09266.1 uracil-DNA glycosylase [Vagococcus elongatus]